jgi:hypothetical protein
LSKYGTDPADTFPAANWHEICTQRLHLDRSAKVVENGTGNETGRFDFSASLASHRGEWERGQKQVVE